MELWDLYDKERKPLGKTICTSIEIVLCACSIKIFFDHFDDFFGTFFIGFTPNCESGSSGLTDSNCSSIGGCAGSGPDTCSQYRGY